MNARVLLPLLMLLCVAALVFRRPDGETAPSPGDAAANPPVAWEAVDFTALRPGEFPPDWDRVMGTFDLVDIGVGVVLQMSPEPMTEGAVLRTKASHGGGGVRARMWGEHGKRAFPRFCVGLHGPSVRPFQLRANPGLRTVELVNGEDTLASVPWSWDPEKPVWLELRMNPLRAGGAELTGRVWMEGEPRPAEPTVRRLVSQSPGAVFAALHGAPYAGRPILFDRIEAAAGAPGENAP